MPAFTAEVPHTLGQKAARERLDHFLERIGEKYKGQISDLNGAWNDDVLSFSFSTFGIKITGTMTVDEDKVQLNGELPFSAMIFKGKIASGIQEALAKALA
jgi:putative polyhydroxyalkanoate system protein